MEGGVLQRAVVATVFMTVSLTVACGRSERAVLAGPAPAGSELAHTGDSGTSAAARADSAVKPRSDASDPKAAENSSIRPDGLQGSLAAAADRDLCERPGRDKVKDLFCSGGGREIRSLLDLRLALGMRLPEYWDVSAAAQGAAQMPQSEIAGVVFTSLSTALSGRIVSSINPRVIVRAGSVLLAFQRGVQRVELAALRDDGERFNFYLVEFEQNCNGHPEGCSPGDLYTRAVERDWLTVSLQDEDDLKNTPADCRQCHMRGRDTPMLLMRELKSPWTHFFGPGSDSPGFVAPWVTERDLLNDFYAAHDDEPYGSISSTGFTATLGFLLERMVPTQQPVLFDGRSIHEERWPLGPEGYADSPATSATWERHHEAFKRGEQLPLPHYDERPTDPDKLSALIAAYQQVRAGDLPVDELPDLADIFPDDPQVRAEIGLETEPNATPVQALIQACCSCHNDVLDQAISRARFNIDLGRLDPSELRIAVERLKLAPDDPGAMPPPEARQLPPEVRANLIAYIERGERTSADDAALRYASEQGMVGGATSLAEPRERSGLYTEPLHSPDADGGVGD